MIGRLYNRDLITVLYGEEIIEGLIWVEVQDNAQRMGWLPRICMDIVTLTPTRTPRVSGTVAP